MAIEEKPQLLEFKCTLESMPEVVWDITYNPNEVISLHVRGNGSEIHCSVELFEDVANFLQSKNIIKPQILTRERYTPKLEPGNFDAALLPPKIEKKNVFPGQSLISSPPEDALTSFDITSAQSVLPYKSSTIEVPEVMPIPESQILKETTISSDIKHEIISRPVIRTRVNDDDPQSAEKEAAAIRGVGKDGAKKTIKSRHQQG